MTHYASDSWTERARARMKVLGESQRSLAQKMGITQGAVAHLLSGRRKAPIKRIESFARALRVDPTWLLFGENTVASRYTASPKTPTSVGERLHHAREHLELTIEVLAEQLGLDAAYVEQMESNQVAVDAPEELAAMLQVSTEWLLYGKKPSPSAQELTESLPVRWVPIIEWKQVAHWEEALADLPESCRRIPIPDDIGLECFGLRIEGDSMMGGDYRGISFTPGSLIVADPGRRPQYNQHVIAVNSETGESTFKQYVRDSGQDYLKPLNPRYPLLELKPPYRMIATVVTVYHSLLDN